MTLEIDLAAMAAAPSFVLAPVAAMVALYTLATRAGRRVAWPAGLLAAALITVVYALVHSRLPVPGLPFVYFDLAIAATGVGCVVRGRRARMAEAEARAERAERLREEEGRRLVAEERLRIARDLHDVLAHHITLVNAQAGVAHYLMPTDPEAAGRALAGIKEASRAAIDDLRATVRLLRQPGDDPALGPSAPCLADLGELAESFRLAGMPVVVERRGATRPCPPATQLAAYRIVEEGLTNACKHAAASSVRICLDYQADVLRITVTDDGHPRQQGPGGSGHGLVGMKERAAAIGGRLTAGPVPSGGFRVLAELPLARVPAEAATVAAAGGPAAGRDGAR